MNVKNNPKPLRKPLLNRNQSQTIASVSSRSEWEGQQTYYEKSNSSSEASGPQCCGQPQNMRRRKNSCPVKFETKTEKTVERKVSPAKLQSYIPFTATKDEDEGHDRNPSFLQPRPNRPRTRHSIGQFTNTRPDKSPSSTQRKASKQQNTIYDKLMEPYHLYHRLTKHNLLTTKKNDNINKGRTHGEKHSKRRSLMNPTSQQANFMGGNDEMSPTLSTDSGLGDCTPQSNRSQPWIDNLARMVTGRDTTKHADDTEWQKVGCVVTKQSRKVSHPGLTNLKEKLNESSSSHSTVKPSLNPTKVNCRDVNKVLTRRPSVTLPSVDSENNIRITETDLPRRYRCLLDLIDDLCQGADTNCDRRRRNQSKETGRRVSLQKEQKINLKKFLGSSTTFGCVKKHLSLSYEVKQMPHLNWNGCSLAPSCGQLLLSFNATFPILGSVRVGLVHSCSSSYAELDCSMLWYTFLAQ